MSQIDQNKSKSRFSDVLSKLSKSKHSLSKDDLSRSLHMAKGKEPYHKQDHVLERSAESFSRTQNNLTKTINNPSQLSEKSPKNSKLLQLKQEKPEQTPSSLQGKTEKSVNRLSKDNSISF
jgi:hypothetical protein